MYTLVEASKLSNDVLSQGVVETFVYDNPLLKLLKWIVIVGNAHTYNRETGEDTAKFYGVNANWDDTSQTVTPYTATLKILGSAVRLDDFLRKTRSNVNDLKKELLTGKAKAMNKAWGMQAVYGNATTDPLAFDGLHVLISNNTYNTIRVDLTDQQSTPLALRRLDQALRMVKGFTPTMILSSGGLQDRVNIFLRGSGVSIATDRDEFGKPIMRYGAKGTPWYVSDHILDTEKTVDGAFSLPTTGSTTTIFILSLEGRGLKGCHSGPMETTPWIPVPGTNTEEAKIRWYNSLMMESLVSCVKIVGIDADGTVTA